MKRWMLAAAIAAATAQFAHAQTQKQTSVATPWVSGYYVGYVSYPVDQIQWRGLSHLMIGPVLPNEDGSLEVSMYNENGPALARQAAAAARARGVKAIAFVGGMDTGPQWAAAAAPGTRARFVANLLALMRDYGFDGLDLDWEPLEDSDRPNLLALARELRAAAPDAILTFPADGASISNHPTDRSFYAELAPYVDQLNLMTYAMGATYQDWLSWHSTALYHSNPFTPTSLDYSIRSYLDAGIPASKLGIGIGFFGQCYTAPVVVPKQALAGARIVGNDNDMSYANILAQYDRRDARRWDDEAKVPYLSFAAPTGPMGCTYISYENAQSIRRKADYVAANGLGGAILWNINQGYVPTLPQGQRSPLLNATARWFLGRRF